MREINPEIANWMFEGIETWNPETIRKTGVRLKNCVSNKFEAYCKVFHPFYISKRKSNRLVSREIYEQKFYEENDLTETKEKSWNEIAKTYEITLNNESNTNIFENKFIEIGWPENLYFPTEGFLPQNQFIELLDILKKFTHNQVIIYQQIPHNNWKNDKTEDFQLANFDETLNYFTGEGFIGYLGDEKKNWMVYTDTDLSFTIIAGSKYLINSIKNSSLESFECNPNTRVDIFANEKG